MIIAVLVGGGVAHAQRGATAGDEPATAGARHAPLPAQTPASVFRSGVDLVALNVVVTDSAQKFIRGLTADSFAVFEDGVRQDVSFFSAGEIPLDLAIVLDTSASMQDKMQTVQEAAVGFASTLGEHDRLLVLDIKDGTKMLAPLSGDLDAALAAIRSTVAGGGTALYNGLYLALREMAKQRGSDATARRQALVVLSDGDDTASLLSFDEVMELAKQSGISVYTITLRTEGLASVHPRGKYFSQAGFTMRSLAQETGGRSFTPADIGELEGIYGVIAEELVSQYALGYTSKNPKRDGAYRRVLVRVAEPAGARVRTRAGYLSARALASVR
jgi:Ca-activated chloride channel family protein